MKKSILISIMAALLFSVFSVTGSAYAQTAKPECPNGCPEHDDMLALFSESLDLPAEELQARLDSGETMAQIALSSGMSFEDFKALMPRGNFRQQANGLFGRANRYAADGTAAPFGVRACQNNPDCTPPFVGQQNGGRGAGRTN